MLADELASSALQLGVVLILAGLFYALAGRRRGKFRVFTGLVTPPMRAVAIALVLAVANIATLLPLTLTLLRSAGLGDALIAEGTIAGQIRAAGWSANTVGVILIIAFLKTALAEEILFRGVIAKRLINRFGLPVGNLLQAMIFGSIHLLIFLAPGAPAFSPLAAAAFFGGPAVLGWIMAKVNETAGKGSIVPGWIIHGVGKAVSYPVMAFL